MKKSEARWKYLMKRYITKIAAVAVLAFSFSSCLEVNNTVNLKKDGSGTFVEEVKLGGQIVTMLDSLSGLGGEGGEAKEMFSEEQAKERATKLGKGVKLTKFEKIEGEGSKGACMTFEFADINELQISLSESTSSLQQMGPPGAEPKAAANEKPITFQYKEGLLTLNNPSAEPNAEQQAEAKKALEEAKANLPEGAAIPDGDDPQAQQMQAMMMEMMKDMKMSLKINIVDGIAETNATHRDGNTVTLMEMNFGKLMENPEIMKELQKLNMQDPVEMQKKIATIEGVKAETKKSVTVKVK
jgi:hypothetical protein